MGKVAPEKEVPDGQAAKRPWNSDQANWIRLCNLQRAARVAPLEDNPALEEMVAAQEVSVRLQVASVPAIRKGVAAEVAGLAALVRSVETHQPSPTPKMVAPAGPEAQAQTRLPPIFFPLTVSSMAVAGVVAEVAPHSQTQPSQAPEDLAAMGAAGPADSWARAATELSTGAEAAEAAHPLGQILGWAAQVSS